MLLAVDMGGTKTKCALFAVKKNHFFLRDEKKYESKGISSFEDMIEDYLRSRGLWQSEDIKSAWFSVAGPYSGDKCSLPNLNMTIDMNTLKKKLSFISCLGWGNDLVALGHGIPYLSEQSLLQLNEGCTRKSEGEELYNKAVLAPGTGLGESIISGEKVYPTEGGHTDFAPICAEDLGLWLFLHQLYGHVSYERILSGPGLVNIYMYLATQDNSYTLTPEKPDPQEISTRALAKTCPLCIKTLDIFVRILGAEAGNLALKSFALGGVYLGGGIPPKIKEKLVDGAFRENFCAKGRFSKMLETVPVYLILDENTPLLGAAALALRQAASEY